MLKTDSLNLYTSPLVMLISVLTTRVIFNASCCSLIPCFSKHSRHSHIVVVLCMQDAICHPASFAKSNKLRSWTVKITSEITGSSINYCVLLCTNDLVYNSHPPYYTLCEKELSPSTFSSKSVCLKDIETVKTLLPYIQWQKLRIFSELTFFSVALNVYAICFLCVTQNWNIISQHMRGLRNLL